MLSLVRGVTRFLDETVGWNRVGIALSVCVIGVAGYVLYDMLNGLDVEEVQAAVEEISLRQMSIAVLFVAAGYFTLTFYDLFALRTIGRADVPYRVAALAGFTSYSIGHNVGASVFTGGAVRYRIYTAWGLDGIEVAKLCFLAGLTFWLGNVAVLGLGITLAPQAASAVDQLPPWLNRVFALGALGVLAGYVTWVWQKPRLIGRQGWQVTLPGGPLTLVQIGIGILDLSFCALAMWMLMPEEPHIGFVTLAVIFVSATLLGFASHSPGGLGVFDAAMLIGLWQFDREELVAGLLIFRLLYYIVPFVLALLVLGVREVWLNFATGRQDGHAAVAAPVDAPVAAVPPTVAPPRQPPISQASAAANDTHDRGSPGA